MAATEDCSHTEAVQSLLARFSNCYKFFTEDYELDKEEFKYQMGELATMSYVMLRYLTIEIMEDAKRQDKEKVNTPQVESADPATAGEDQPELVTESADPAGAGEDLVTPLGVSSTGQEDELSLSLSVGEDSFPDDSGTSVLSIEVQALPDVSMSAEEPDEMSDTDNASYFLDTLFKDKQDAPEVNFVERILRTIKRVAPNLRYKPKHLRRKKFKVVPYEFSSVWRNVSSIFSEEENSNQSNGSIVPKIAWEKVNVGGLKKLPNPKKFPVLSASADPKFYVHNCSCDKTKEGILCSCRMTGVDKAKYTQEFPHGYIYGFASNLGVVPVPDTPMFGHVWDVHSSSWLLHAEVAPDDTPAPSTPSEGRRERTPPRRRSTGTSRGTSRRTRRTR